MLGEISFATNIRAMKVLFCQLQEMKSTNWKKGRKKNGWEEDICQMGVLKQM